MRKMLVGVVVSLAVIFCLTGFVAAKATTVKIHAVAGEVTAIDATANTLSIKDAKGNAVDFVLDGKTKVSGKVTKIADVKVGDKSIVKFKKDGDKNVAVAVTVKK